MTKFSEAQQEIYLTLLRYGNVIDRLVGRNDEIKKVIIEEFGSNHSPLYLEAVQWYAMRQMQVAAAQKEQEEAQKAAEVLQKAVDSTTETIDKK